MFVPYLWQSCAILLAQSFPLPWHNRFQGVAQLCHRNGTTLPKAWHNHFEGMSQAECLLERGINKGEVSIECTGSKQFHSSFLIYLEYILEKNN